MTIQFELLFKWTEIGTTVLSNAEPRFLYFEGTD